MPATSYEQQHTERLERSRAQKRAEKNEHGDGEGDSENPLPAARTFRKRPSRAKGAAKKPAAKK